jgi:hypothetical protein
VYSKCIRAYLAINLLKNHDCVFRDYRIQYEAAVTRRISVIFWDVCFFLLLGTGDGMMTHRVGKLTHVGGRVGHVILFLIYCILLRPSSGLQDNFATGITVQIIALPFLQFFNKVLGFKKGE